MAFILKWGKPAFPLQQSMLQCFEKRETDYLGMIALGEETSARSMAVN